MSDNYWTRTLQSRLSRRKALAAGGAGALGAAFLAACGGDDGGDGGSSIPKGPVDTSGLLYQPVDTTKQAVRGGTYESFVPSYPEGFDVYRGDNITFFHTVHSYQRLLSYKNGVNGEPGDGSVEGDAAASWEVSPDNTQITFKLRKNNKWDERPPTSSRVMTSADVKHSWDKISATTAPNGRELVNSRNPDAPILSLTTPDADTVIIKLKEPMSAILGMLAYSWYFSVIPMETEGKFDVKQEMRGTGPWMLTNYVPGTNFQYKRNPNYWKGDRPFLDGVNYPAITDVSQQLAQFKAKRHWGGGGNILGGTFAPNADLVLATKKENPEALMRGLSPFTGQSGKNDWVPSKLELPSNPFQDVRIRRAMSMLMDRDAYIDAFGNVPALKKEGLPIETGWHGFVPVAWKAYGAWVDPKDEKAYGPDSQYYKFNPTEAKKLMEAAGKYPIETEYTYSGTLPFGTSLYKNQNAVLIEMLQAGGHFKLKQINTPDHFSVYDPKYLFGHGQYEGISPEPFGTWPHLDMGLWAIYMPGGRNDYVYKPVPKANDLAKAHRKEFDRKKQLEIAHEWEKAMAVEMPTVPIAGTWTTFAFHWPWLANVGGVNAPITTAQQADTMQHYWYDKSKDTRTS